MEIVELTCLESGLFFLGGFKILEYPPKIEATLDYLYTEIFLDPWNNWDKIRQVFETFGSTSTVSNASFSKNEDVGDGVKTSWKLNGISQGVLVQCYNIADDLGILVDSTASSITFSANPTTEERVNLKKWQALATQYQIIKDIQTTQIITAFGISPLIDSVNTLDRSPQQLQMYAGYLAKTTVTASEQIGAIITESALYQCPFDTTDVIFSDLIDILRDDWWTNMLTVDTVDVSYSDSTSFHVITADDLSNDYIDFSYNNYVAHLQYAVILPADTTGDVSVVLKTCYGFEYGDSKTWDCTTCKYVDDCNEAQFLNPFYMDSQLQYRLGLDGDGSEGDRVKIVYKQVTIL